MACWLGSPPVPRRWYSAVRARRVTRRSATKVWNLTASAPASAATSMSRRARRRSPLWLTPTGVAEKTRLTYEYMTYSLQLYRRTRGNLREVIARMHADGIKRIALYGVGEAAELAYLTLREFGLEPVGIFAREAGGQFLGFPVRPLGELVHEECDGVIVATFDRPEQQVAELARAGVPREKCLTLRRLVGSGAPAAPPK